MVCTPDLSTSSNFQGYSSLVPREDLNKNRNNNIVLCHLVKGGSRGSVQGVRTPPPTPEI